MGNTASKREDSSRGEVGPHHMLLIGETGSGKTSFLNLVCNFQLVHRLGFDTDVTQFRKYNHIHLENQVARTMESKTTGSALYEVQFDDVRIGIVDTPGFGDTRGLDLDKKNVKNIVDKVKDSSYMHCICFVINGRNARATPQFNYVVSEVSAVLPKMSVQNMIVVVTNTKDEFESNIDLSELTHFLGLEIPRDHIFYLENPYCKLDKLKLKGQIASDVVAQDLKKAFTDASITLEAILKTMMRFNSMNTCDFMTLFLMKEAVERTTLELMVACQNQTALSNVIKQKKQEIDEAVKLKQLNQSFVNTYVVPKVVIVYTEDRNTLCGAEGCFSNCHLSCMLPKQGDHKVTMCDKDIIKLCHCMDKDTGMCSECGHSYEFHYNTQQMLEKKEETVEYFDEPMKQKYEMADKSIEALSVLLKEKSWIMSLRAQKK